MENFEKWLSMEEMTQYLSVSRETILNWIKKKGMPAAKIGRMWRFKASEVDTWIQSCNASSSAKESHPQEVCNE